MSDDVHDKCVCVHVCACVCVRVCLMCVNSKRIVSSALVSVGGILLCLYVFMYVAFVLVNVNCFLYLCIIL